eukprot:scaffold11053_cov43-Phaeocystis_antarctica.AAC.2
MAALTTLGMDARLDVLFVEEAGQLPLAHLIGAAIPTFAILLSPFSPLPLPRRGAECELHRARRRSDAAARTDAGEPSPSPYSPNFIALVL